MIGTLTKKFTARVFTLWFHWRPFHSTFAAWCQGTVMFSFLFWAPLYLHASTTADLRCTFAGIYGLVCMLNMYSVWFFSRKEKQIGFSVNSLKLCKGEDRIACCWSFQPCQHLPCNAVYKYSEVHWILLHIMAIKTKLQQIGQVLLTQMLRNLPVLGWLLSANHLLPQKLQTFR